MARHSTLNYGKKDVDGHTCLLFQLKFLTVKCLAFTLISVLRVIKSSSVDGDGNVISINSHV